MNVTIGIDDDLLARARALAQRRGMSLQALLREQLERIVGSTPPEEIVAELRQRWAAAGVASGAPALDRKSFYDDLLDDRGRRG